MSNTHEETIYGTYGEFEPVPADLDNDEAWAEHDAEADAWFEAYNPIEQGMYDDDPNPYHGDYSDGGDYGWYDG